MPRVREKSLNRVHAKLCLACGYDGPELQEHAPDETFECPRCGADLYARPARSYAELEGLDLCVSEVVPASGSALGVAGCCRCGHQTAISPDSRRSRLFVFVAGCAGLFRRIFGRRMPV